MATLHAPMLRVAWILAIAATAACENPTETAVATRVVVPITACPDGAVMDGAAPPEGLRQRCQRSVGERHGASKEWCEDRRERSYSEWWAGEKHGRFTLWFKNGKVRSEGAHRHGAPAGEWRYFREDGSLLQHQSFAVLPPPTDWIAQALAGHPPVKDPAAAAALVGKPD